jgi:HAD superfamily hydrolase (TIGR01509 family)
MTAKASDVVKELHKKYPLGIVTNRVRGHIFETPEMKEIETLFTGVVGYEDTEKHKPDPEPLFLSAKKMGVAPNKCVFIGDAETDMQAGQAAGMKTILYLPDSFPQIPSQIEELMS